MEDYMKKTGKKIAGPVVGLITLLAVLALLIYTAVSGWGDTGDGSAANIKLGLDLSGGVSITYEAVGDEAPSDADMNDTVYKLQRRVEQYSTEAQVYREGSDRITIEIPGVTDANKILEELGQPGSLYFIRHKAADGTSNYDLDYSTYTYQLASGKTISSLKESGDIVLEGTDVADAQAGYTTDSMNNQQIVVELTLTDEGKQKFAEATQAAYDEGQAEGLDTGDSIGIYYDGEFISVPTVNEPITGGQATITGMSTIEEANNLASTIRIGGLKVELKELRSQVVGAQLGQDAIDTSLVAGVVGLCLVMLLMLILYRIMGLAADLALLTYCGLMSFILVAFNEQITLTLPGIAGILLSIGMAVDANVIIFSRIQELVRARAEKGGEEKVTVTTGILNEGYNKALSAIIDGNVTTLIAAAVLGILGSGSVKGFAITLAIGILLSMFTALFVTKWYMRIFLALGARNEKLYGRGIRVKKMKIVEKKKVLFVIAAAAVASGLISMGVHAASGKGALNYSLDFVGGTSTTVAFKEDMDLDQINDEVVPIFYDVTGDSNVQVQKVAGTTEEGKYQVIFKTRTLSLEERSDLDEQLIDQFGIDQEDIEDETISSTISSEMTRDAVVAVIVALALMLVYIWFRFKDMRFGASSVLALCHDVLVVLACYAIVRISVGSTFIACMLTIVGYSINATIVIFDRVRENLKGRNVDNMTEAEAADVVDQSISQTMTRSLFTSITTFIMVLCLFIFGVASIRDFALPIMTGIVAGCYSSVCLAGTFWYTLHEKHLKKTPVTPAKTASKSSAAKAAE